jgi:hypothetical protein
MFQRSISEIMKNTNLTGMCFGDHISARRTVLWMLIYYFDRNDLMGVSMELYSRRWNGSDRISRLDLRARIWGYRDPYPVFCGSTPNPTI